MPGSRTSSRTPNVIHDAKCHTACATIELVGRRWNSAILLALDRGATRFGEMLAMVDGLSDRMLALRLKELERAGLVSRTVKPTTPVSVHYSLTAQGHELIAALQPLVAYGHRWESPPEPPVQPART